VAHARQQAGLPVVIVPTQRARHFAKSMRGDLKTDRVDAQLLAYFAYCLTPFSDTLRGWQHAHSTLALLTQ
jgi:hypothetical protein